MIRPLKPSDIEAGLPLYDAEGGWLGVAMGPPFDGYVKMMDETGPEPEVVIAEWRDVRIGHRLPT